MNRKTFFTLLVCIVVFVVGYLYYVKIDRENSIEKYFDDPMIGDIYKIKSDDDEGRLWVRYLMLVIRQDNQLIFKASKMQADASVDYLLRSFDENFTVIYTLQEMHDIRKGLWHNNKKNHTTLIEIVRKN